MRPYGVTERLFTVLRHILALGVVHHRAVAADIALGGFGLVQGVTDGTKAALAAAEAMRSSVRSSMAA